MRKFLSEQSGRSMIEMLGVLAIIGVLSVGGIAGYSKAMAKYKQNKLGDQISMLITNIRTLYGNSQDYTGLDTAAAINMGAVDREMQVTPGTATAGIKHVYTTTASVFTKATNSNKSFYLIVTNLPSSACTYLASADYGSTNGSGWNAVGVMNSNGSETTTLDNATKKAVNGGGTETGEDNTPTSIASLPMTVANAAAGCSNTSNQNTVIFEFQ